MSNSTDPSTMCFTFGSGSSKKAENIRFEGNTLDVKATMSLLHSRNVNGLSIKNNKIKFEKVNLIDNGKINTFVMYFPKDNQENNSKNVVIENNNIKLNNATSQDIKGIISSSAQNITFAQYHTGNLNYDSNITNNTIECNYDEISAGEKSNLLMFNGGTLDNHLVTFEENTINFEKANYKRNLIYILNLADTTRQTIKIINNKMDGYKQGWKDKNQETHNIIIENN